MVGKSVDLSSRLLENALYISKLHGRFFAVFQCDFHSQYTVFLVNIIACKKC